MNKDDVMGGTDGEGGLGGEAVTVLVSVFGWVGSG